MIPLQVVKDYLDITSTDQDVALQAIIDRLGETLSNKLQWYFGPPREVTEVLNGMGTTRLFLRQPPVLEMVDNNVTIVPPLSIATRTGIGYPWQDVDSTLYEVAGRRIVASDRWPKGERNIKVTYWEGFVDVPPDITQLLLEFIEGRVTTPAGELQSEKIGDYAYTVSATSNVETSRLWPEIWERYRRGRV